MIRFIAIPAVIGEPTIDNRQIDDVQARADGDVPFVAILEEQKVGHEGQRAVGIVDTVLQLGNMLVVTGSISDEAGVEPGEYGCGADMHGGDVEVGEDDVIRSSGAQFVGFTIYANGETAPAWPQARVVVYEDPRFDDSEDEA